MTEPTVPQATITSLHSRIRAQRQRSASFSAEKTEFSPNVSPVRIRPAITESPTSSLPLSVRVRRTRSVSVSTQGTEFSPNGSPPRTRSTMSDHSIELMPPLYTENDIRLQYILARRYERKNNRERAIFWYNKAASQGYERALRRLKELNGE